jgi:topoisomerase-4 subunit A
MVKRFLIETSTADKEFVFISEAIGSRLVAVTTAESAEVEVEVSKGKDKPKKTEVLNLEDLVDIKGWKALGNRLSEYKVTKVNLVQDEEPAFEEASDEADEEATESDDDAQSSKKKIESAFPQQNPEPPVGEDGQAALFAEPEKPKHQPQQRPAPKPKIKVEQQNLFGQSPQHESSQKQKSESEKEPGEIADVRSVPILGQGAPKDEGKDDGKSFNVGETIEFDI